MLRIDRLALPLVIALGLAVPALAQTPPAAPPQPEPEKKSLKDRLKEPDQAGGIHLTEHFAVVFGGIKQGSGIALGPALSTKFKDGGFAQLKAVYSVKQFKLVQARYDTRRFWSDRAIVISRARWQDAPELPLYRLGPDSPDVRVDYSEKKTEVSSRGTFKVAPLVTMNLGYGVERYTTGGGRIDLDPQFLGLLAPVPGLATKPTFGHAAIGLGVDSRAPTSDYSRRGGFAEAELHAYNDWKGGQDSFRRVELTGQQLIPTHGERGVIDLSARAWLTQSSDVLGVPFYLMPTLGGGDLLKAYPSYRFRDRNALLLKSEYRWAVHKMVDIAGVYEAGKVASKVSGLKLENMAHSVAIGLRGHTDKASLFRADLAYGSEGLGFRIGFSSGGS
jgi:hypothetical protein